MMPPLPQRGTGEGKDGFRPKAGMTFARSGTRPLHHAVFAAWSPSPSKLGEE
jgi:hypothetical protein